MINRTYEWFVSKQSSLRFKRKTIAAFCLIFLMAPAALVFGQDTTTQPPPQQQQQTQSSPKGITKQGGAEEPKKSSNAVDLGNAQIYNKSLAALTILFVLAVLLENAFALLFNWRVFLAYFSIGGVKTIIMIVASVAVVSTFNLDILGSLIDAYKTADLTPASGPGTQFITALILAGGSTGIYNIMHALGYRSQAKEELHAKPPAKEAWLAVHLKRKNSVGRVEVSIRDLGVAAASDLAPIAGTVGFRRPRLIDLLTRNPNRFPTNGGAELIPGHAYAVELRGKNSAGKDINSSPKKFVLAERAIFDIDIVL